MDHGDGDGDGCNIPKVIPFSCLQDTGVFQGMNGSVTRPLEKITLLVTFGDPENFHTEEIICDIADTLLPYNGILGRSALAKFRAVSLFAYNVMKIWRGA